MKVDFALNYLEEYHKDKNHDDSTNYNAIKLVLNSLKDEYKRNGYNINTRVLRGCHDVGVFSYRDYEGTELESAIDDILNELYVKIPHYKTLKILGEDFGRGQPF